MATRGTISIENLDGTVSTIYSHWDNYIQNNGVILQKYYNTRESVEKLVSGGGISSLGRKVSDTPLDFDNRDNYDYTIYYSYRGEITEIRHFKDFDTYEKDHQYEEYSYIFTKDNVWSVFDTYGAKDWLDLEYIIDQRGIIDPYEVE
jgi:hypothetical protein